LKQYDEGGYAAWESRMPPGASPLITEEMDEWLKQTVLNRTPVDFGYDTTLWTCALLADLLQKEFAITVTGGAVSLHLNKLGLSYQKPAYPDVERDPQEVEQFLNDKWLFRFSRGHPNILGVRCSRIGGSRPSRGEAAERGVRG
jgi:transposase